MEIIKHHLSRKAASATSKLTKPSSFKTRMCHLRKSGGKFTEIYIKCEKARWQILLARRASNRQFYLGRMVVFKTWKAARGDCGKNCHKTIVNFSTKIKRGATWWNTYAKGCRCEALNYLICFDVTWAQQRCWIIINIYYFLLFPWLRLSSTPEGWLISLNVNQQLFTHMNDRFSWQKRCLMMEREENQLNIFYGFTLSSCLQINLIECFCDLKVLQCLLSLVFLPKTLVVESLWEREAIMLRRRLILITLSPGFTATHHVHIKMIF